MAAEWWWFLVLNAIVATVAVLSMVRPPHGDGITRRASSVMLQRLRSSIFSFPSATFHTAPAPLTQPEGATSTTVSQESEEPAEASTPSNKPASTPRSRAPTPRHAPSAKEEGEEKEDPNAMSMEEAYALVQAARRRPAESEPAVEAKASRSDVDAKAEEFIQRFKEGLRQQRLNSIFNYTQMLKKRAFGDGGRRQPAAQPDQR